MKKLILIAIIAVTITAQAQPVYVDRLGFNPESIAGIDIGWMEIRKHNTLPGVVSPPAGGNLECARRVITCKMREKLITFEGWKTVLN